MSNIFVGVDLSQIEARATGWVAGDTKFLSLFDTSDPYCTYGRNIFGREITKKNDPEERNAAKAAVLAFGFAGGIGAGQRIGTNYNFDFNVMADLILPLANESELKGADYCYKYYRDKMPPKPLPEREGFAVDVLKQRYRQDFSDIVNYWGVLETAFLMGGDAGMVNIKVHPSGLRVMTLPSGYHQMFYHGVKQWNIAVCKECDLDGQEHHISDRSCRYCGAALTRSKGYSYQGRFGRSILWKGTLIENVAQAVNEDISGWYKLQANKEIAPVIHHCYDEFTMECEASQVDSVMSQLKDLTKNNKPDWCVGLNLDFSYWSGQRYGK